ncbi:hypothetical protein MKW94_008813 [Papaver nudicaule]|uniref:Uncharacterized protein n=1 Tax=Papaver nudicaule TaxID=74823 RepID=A0AA41SMR1_PAPNU|nr:hypothetical protein [Papaver nudicaule]
MESFTRRKARPTIIFILCLLVIFKLVTTFNSGQIDHMMMYSNISRKLLGRVPEVYPIRSPRASQHMRVNSAPEDSPLPPITLRAPPPPSPRSLLHQVFP